MREIKKILITGGRGYIGSRLTRFLANWYEITTCDLNLFPTNTDPNLPMVPYRMSGEANHMNCNFTDIQDLTPYDAIIHLAGHSSVPWVDNFPGEARKNNVTDFKEFTQGISPGQILIYASSASVYGDSQGVYCTEEHPLRSPLKEYDLQKMEIDEFMLSQKDYRWYGLRFGTVCGYSPVPRNELIINAMAKNAISKGDVDVGSNFNYITERLEYKNRAILGMTDLCRAIYDILRAKEWKGIDAPSGIYNLASDNASMEEIGLNMSVLFNAVINNKRNYSPYSFKMRTVKFEQTFRFRFRENICAIAMASLANDFRVEREWNKQVN